MALIDHLKSRDEIVLDPKPYEASVLADSIANGVRLTTLCVKIPRFELPAFNTHRVFSRNSASSRAIPVKKKLQMVREDPYIPLVFGKNKRGMQSEEAVENDEAAEAEWRQALRMALHSAEQLMKLNVHKQLANRLLEPFSWQTIIVTATEWDNWDALRVSEDAQGEIALAAKNMLDARAASTPVEMKPGDWHLPLIFAEDAGANALRSIGMPNGERVPANVTTEAISLNLARISVARCARVSYLTHGGERDLAADFSLYNKLRSKGHMSPLEHAAKVGEVFDGAVQFMGKPAGSGLKLEGASCFEVTYSEGGDPKELFFGPFIGNFRAPWVQLRKMVPNEAVFVGD